MAYYGAGYSSSAGFHDPAMRPVAIDPARQPKREPSMVPHVKRILAFERTPLEAWHEYQEELTARGAERHAVRIQAYARGMRDRSQIARVRLQQDKILVLQRAVRVKLARKQLARKKTQYRVAALMAKRERRAVMLLELAFLKRRERKQASAASILQAHYLGRKARQQRANELTKRKLVYVMAKGQAKAALRIQYAWWQYKVVVANRRDEAGRAAVAERGREEEARLAQATAQREQMVMEKPVAKKARSLPLGFQRKQMHMDGGKRVLSYWKYSEKKQARVKELALDAVQAIEQRSGAHDFLLVLTVGGPAAAGASRKAKGPFTFKLDDLEASDVWLKYLRAACPRARVTLTTIP